MPTSIDDLDIPAVTLAHIRTLIRSRVGLTFQGATTQKLITAISQRVHHTKSGTPENYYTHLEQTAQEFDQLIELLTINETFFYRESDHLDLLCEHLYPILRPLTSSQHPLKIMSAGCSSGEEAYSVAIALNEKFGEGAQKAFEIVAGDLDQTILKKAQKGVYTSFSFRSLSPILIERYFDEIAPGRYQIKDFIKKMVTFSTFNLIGSETPSLFSQCDVIFYRNVSIYFDEETRKSILNYLSRLIKPHGFLIMGTSETLANDFGALDLISHQDCFFFAKKRPHQSGIALKTATKSDHSNAQTDQDYSVSLPSKTRSKLANLRKQAKFNHIKSKDPKDSDDLGEDKPFRRSASGQINQTKQSMEEAVLAENWREARKILNADNGMTKTEKTLYSALVALYSNDFKTALQDIQSAISADEFSVDAHVLLGLTHKYKNQWDKAIQAFKKAIYLDRSYWIAHYHLADCLRQIGQDKQAQRGFMQTLTILDQLKDGALGNNSGLKLPYKIALDQVRHLSNLHVRKLSGEEVR